MKHNDLVSMLQSVYQNHNQCPKLLAVGWEVDSAQIVQLAAVDFNITCVVKVGEALRCLSKGQKFDAVLIHANADFDVLVATAALRLYTSVPIILLYSEVNSVNPALAVDAGADDWLTMTIHPSEFTARVYARIRRHHMGQRPSVFGYSNEMNASYRARQQNLTA